MIHVFICAKKSRKAQNIILLMYTCHIDLSGLSLDLLNHVYTI